MAAACGQRLAGQVVVRDEHRNARSVRLGDAFQRGNAVVHGHDQRGPDRGRDPHDLGREAVAELEAIRNEEPGVDVAEPAQLPHHDGRARGAVGVEVADDQYPAAAAMAGQEQFHGRVHAAERTHRQQSLETEVQVFARPRGRAQRRHAERRMQAGAAICGQTRFVDGSAQDLAGHASTSASGFAGRQNLSRTAPIGREGTLTEQHVDGSRPRPRASAVLAGTNNRCSAIASAAIRVRPRRPGPRDQDTRRLGLHARARTPRAAGRRRRAGARCPPSHASSVYSVGRSAAVARAEPPKPQSQSVLTAGRLRASRSLVDRDARAAASGSRSSASTRAHRRARPASGRARFGPPRAPARRCVQSIVVRALELPVARPRPAHGT